MLELWLILFSFTFIHNPKPRREEGVELSRFPHSHPASANQIVINVLEMAGFLQNVSYPPNPAVRGSSGFTPHLAAMSCC